MAREEARPEGTRRGVLSVGRSEEADERQRGSGMWLMTEYGFFSAVKKGRGDGKDICVRGRARKDLDALRHIVRGEQAGEIKIEEGVGTDYPYRVYLTREEWADAVEFMSRSIDYSNFKSRIGRDDAERAHIYSDVWGVLLEITRAERKHKKWRKELEEEDKKREEGAGKSSGEGVNDEEKYYSYGWGRDFEGTDVAFDDVAFDEDEELAELDRLEQKAGEGKGKSVLEGLEVAEGNIGKGDDEDDDDDGDGGVISLLSDYQEGYEKGYEDGFKSGREQGEDLGVLKALKDDALARSIFQLLEDVDRRQQLTVLMELHRLIREKRLGHALRSKQD